jgi:hypothetical protein
LDGNGMDRKGKDWRGMAWMRFKKGKRNENT